jgi:hypothetical protein
LNRTCSEDAAVYSLTGIDTRPNEITPEATARAGMSGMLLRLIGAD